MTNEMLSLYQMNKSKFGDEINLIYLYKDKSCPIIAIEKIKNGDSYITLIFDKSTFFNFVEKANVLSVRNAFNFPPTRIGIISLFGIEFDWKELTNLDTYGNFKMITIPIDILIGILKFLEIKLPDSFLYDSTW